MGVTLSRVIWSAIGTAGRSERVDHDTAQTELARDRMQALLPFPDAEHVVRVLQLGQQLHGVAVVHVDARLLERAAQRRDAGIHVARNLVDRLQDVAHRYAFHRRGVVAHADQVADRAAAAALAVVRGPATRQDGGAALSEQMADGPVIDFLFAEIRLGLHF
ncbi:hypothetical protein BH759_20675 [Ralstonia solanacearum]|nr:hypothetical protein BH759_20675 [Ralstonia solanacearum]